MTCGDVVSISGVDRAESEPAVTRPNSGAIRSTERARALGVRSGAARRRNRKPKDAPKDAATASHWFA